MGALLSRASDIRDRPSQCLIDACYVSNKASIGPDSDNQAIPWTRLAHCDPNVPVNPGRFRMLPLSGPVYVTGSNLYLFTLSSDLRLSSYAGAKAGFPALAPIMRVKVRGRHACQALVTINME